MIRSKKITNAARGEQCTLQIVGVCNGNPETVVFCHFPDRDTHGMGHKADDVSGGFGCSACHDYLDGRVPPHDAARWRNERDGYLRRSQQRTMRRLFELGILCIK